MSERDERDERAARLAAQLRANLRRRKAQSRATGERDAAVADVPPRDPD